MSADRRLVVTGANGLLGSAIRATDFPGWSVLPLTHDDLEITDGAAVARKLADLRPAAVLHCAAMTQVDVCETAPERAFAINADGARNLARACRKAGARLIAFSTDYVFDGNADHPYAESDPAENAATVYGRSKRAGEKAIFEELPDGALVCRLAWLYDGVPHTKHRDFPHTILRLASENRPFLKVVDDQRGNPTSAQAVAQRMPELLARQDLDGILHLTCEGETTWFGFAKELLRLLKIPQELLPCTTDEFPRPAPRPRNSSLAKTRLAALGLEPMPHWQQALQDAIREWHS